jgi:hypothetical protein
VADLETINSGGFWCYGCLVGKPAHDISPDSRYCFGCYDFLLAEARLLDSHTRKAWVPAPESIEVSPTVKKGVAKAGNKGNTPEGIMQHIVGRPRKEGKVHRVTEWRRKKKLQRVMV